MQNPSQELDKAKFLSNAMKGQQMTKKFLQFIL